MCLNSFKYNSVCFNNGVIFIFGGFLLELLIGVECSLWRLSILRCLMVCKNLVLYEIFINYDEIELGLNEDIENLVFLRNVWLWVEKFENKSESVYFVDS